MVPKPGLPAAPNVPVPNDGVAAAPNRFVDCVVAVAPNKPYTAPRAADNSRTGCIKQIQFVS